VDPCRVGPDADRDGLPDACDPSIEVPALGGAALALLAALMAGIAALALARPANARPPPRRRRA
jgi:hypothetical protein